MNDDQISERTASTARSKYGDNDAENREIFRQSYHSFRSAELEPRPETIDLEYNIAIFEHAWADENTRSKHSALLIRFAIYILCSMSHLRWLLVGGEAYLEKNVRVLHAAVSRCISFFDSIGFLETLVRALKTVREPYNKTTIESDVTLYDEENRMFTVSSGALEQAVACINIEYKAKQKMDMVITNFPLRR